MFERWLISIVVWSVWNHKFSALPSVYKHSFKDFSRTYFNVTNFLFSAKTNVLAISGVTLTNKSLLFLYNTHINIDSLPFVPILLGPCSVLYWI